MVIVCAQYQLQRCAESFDVLLCSADSCGGAKPNFFRRVEEINGDQSADHTLFGVKMIDLILLSPQGSGLPM